MKLQVNDSKKVAMPMGNAHQQAGITQAKAIKPPASGIGFADKQGATKKKHKKAGK